MPGVEHHWHTPAACKQTHGAGAGQQSCATEGGVHVSHPHGGVGRGEGLANCSQHHGAALMVNTHTQYSARWCHQQQQARGEVLGGLCMWRPRENTNADHSRHSTHTSASHMFLHLPGPWVVGQEGPNPCPPTHHHHHHGPCHPPWCVGAAEGCSHTHQAAPGDLPTPAWTVSMCQGTLQPTHKRHSTQTASPHLLPAHTTWCPHLVTLKCLLLQRPP